ncbi:MAG: hypothetical protein ACOC25_02070 [Alkalispirochaetaceae bacterium]
MAQYYYAVATLPSLSLEETSYLSIEGFCEFMREQLTENDYGYLSRSSLDPPKAFGDMPKAYVSFARFVVGLRNALSKERAGELGWELEEHLRLDDRGETGMTESEAIVRAREALNAENPFRAEEAIIRAEWALLDELEVGQFFSIEKIIIYYLRLQLCERFGDMTIERGVDRYDEQYARIANQFQGIERSETVIGEA